MLFLSTESDDESFGSLRPPVWYVPGPHCLTRCSSQCFSYTLWTVGSGVFSKTKDSAHPNKHAGNLVLAMIFFYYAFYNIAMSALLVSYTVEM